MGASLSPSWDAHHRSRYLSSVITPYITPIVGIVT
jgi:hypothetical protein